MSEAERPRAGGELIRRSEEIFGSDQFVDSEMEL